MRSNAERFIEDALLAAEGEATDDGADDGAGAAPLASRADLGSLRSALADAEARLARADAALDALYARAFAGVHEVAVEARGEDQGDQQGRGEKGGGDDGNGARRPAVLVVPVPVPQPMSARAFSALSRDDPSAAAALLRAAAQDDAQDRGRGARWRALQPALATARLARGRADGEAAALRARLEDAERGRAMAAEGRLRLASSRAAAGDDPGRAGNSSSNTGSAETRGADAAPAAPAARAASPPAEIVLVCGFESFNVALYRQVARRLAARPELGVRLAVYSDRDLADDASGGRRAEVAAALSRAGLAFASLLFDYDSAEWLRPLLARVPQVLVFESALELMSCTRLGGFKMGAGGGAGGDAAEAAAAPSDAADADADGAPHPKPPPPPGPPPAVKKILSLFGSGREEDRMVGYLAFLKAGPKLLKFVPGRAARDLRGWLTAYGYWNQGGARNVEAMFEFLAREYLLAPPPAPAPAPAGEAGGGPAAAAGAAAAAGGPLSPPSQRDAGEDGGGGLGGLLGALAAFVAEATRGALPEGARREAARARAAAAASPPHPSSFAPSSSAAAYTPPPPLETPATGCLHPDYPPAAADAGEGGQRLRPPPPSPYFATPADYVRWYAREGPLRDRLPASVLLAAGGSAGEASAPRGPVAPVVGLLLYRKHVITEQAYVAQLIRLMEGEGVIPVPIFINGVEAHTVVRDALTSRRERASRRRHERRRRRNRGGALGGLGGALGGGGEPDDGSGGGGDPDAGLYHDYADELDAASDAELFNPTLSPRAVPVDAVVNTIGFPLVGGPAGTMEGGRQAEVAAAILRAKGVPYVVAAPLLIQSVEQWARDGVSGLQSVVLYALPELDGAVDAVPLGGLVGDDIFLVPERVRRLAGRLRRWHALRTTAPRDRRVAILSYGFPPGVGAVGTAALLNVPRSLVASLRALELAGHDLGGADLTAMGEAALRADVAGVASSALTAAGLRGEGVGGSGGLGGSAGGEGAAGGAGLLAAAAAAAATAPPSPPPSEVAAFLARLRVARPAAHARLRDAAAGEALVAALRLLTEEPRAVAAGAEAVRALARRAADAAAAADGAAAARDAPTPPGGVSAAVARAAGVALACVGVRAVADEVAPKQLAAWLRFDPSWGPSEWGPLPYLPDNDALVARMEAQWGDLSKHAARNAGGPLLCTSRGGFLVAGLQLGNVFLGVQPALGIEGDPMRLLFERDLTPHPQYAAFYRWLALGGWAAADAREDEGKEGAAPPSSSPPSSGTPLVGQASPPSSSSDAISLNRGRRPADAVLTFGMHGTHEWLPGSPLGSTALSWPDALLGDLPNIYLYSGNNPSEAIVAKRRGFGTLVSHNVPAYGRAGLYEHLAALKELLQELRDAAAEGGGGAAGGGVSGCGAAATAAALRVPVADALVLAGLQADLPFYGNEAELRLASMPAGGELRAAAEVEARARAGSAGAAPSPPPLLVTPENVEVVASPEAFAAYCSRLYTYLLELESRLFSEGLHAIGGDGDGDGDGDGAPSSRSAAAADARVSPRSLAAYLSAYFGDDRMPADAAMAVAVAPASGGVGAAREALERVYAAASRGKSAGSVSAAPPALDAPSSPASLAADAVAVRDALAASPRAEVSGLLRGLAGGHVPAGLGGDLLRDGPGVLPTGRNIYATDPYRMPSPAAIARGSRAAAAVLAQHRAANRGAFPEAVSVNLWGLDAIKTRGESVAMVLHFVGARVVKEGTGRVARFELVPLDALAFDDPLTGERGLPRPRVDVVCSMSGIFRDAFQNVVDLLDDLFQRAAAAEGEDDARNYVRKHARALMAGSGAGASAGLVGGGGGSTGDGGVDAATAARRIFSNPAGDYGSMVNERVGQGNWESGEELGATWAARNAFSYGRGAERGVARPELLAALLSGVDRVVQCVDSVEYGLTDIQEYYANTGGLLRAARDARQASLTARAAPGDAGAGAALVACSVVESFSASGAAAGPPPPPRELDDVLRREYRAKLCNPRWAEAMAAQGSGGAFEIGQRFTALVGWGGTSGFADKWAWDQAAQTYALDARMAARLRRANPQAFKNVVARCLEAAGRGLWDADPRALERLRELYGELDDEMEGVAKTGGEAPFGPRRARPGFFFGLSRDGDNSPC